MNEWMKKSVFLGLSCLAQDPSEWGLLCPFEVMLSGRSPAGERGTWSRLPKLQPWAAGDKMGINGRITRTRI